MVLLPIEKMLEIKAAIEKGGVEGKQLAKQFGVSDALIYRYSSHIRKGTFDSWLENLQTTYKKFYGKNGHIRKSPKLPHRPTLAERAATSPSFAPRLKGDKLQARILALKEKGLTYREIGEKIGMSTHGVGYYTSARGRRKQDKVSLGELDSPGKEQMNGHHPTTNKHILIGIAYAETERFITNLSERIAVPAEVLRRRLAELLGHSPLR